ncbi:hypothetical protein [Klebsiella phage Kpn02]|uniref:Uncharacterized protein n=1 Tax=Klebsiella phage Kpn02 TaxID=3044023 RepID=A0AAT9V5L7_9CAUD|nr:hypothetical protein [Klebsiella phage Kpn02]
MHKVPHHLTYSTKSSHQTLATSLSSQVLSVTPQSPHEVLTQTHIICPSSKRHHY